MIRIALLFSLLLSSPSTQAADSAVLASTNPNIFVDLAKKTIPSVVNIQTVSRSKMATNPQQEDLFRKFFEDFFKGRKKTPPRPKDDEEDSDEGGEPGGAFGSAALGTGFIIDESGLVLTNNHVVQGADEIKIRFTEADDETPTDGVVVGRDPDLDLALIRVKTKRKLQPMILGDSDSLQVGEFVMAIGNPFGQGHSVTHGIISAKDRKSPDFQLANYLQTDTPINPGNSGGPLVNMKGEVIGINNAIDQRAQGIGFAIPISLVKAVLPQLKAKGKVSRGYIGVQAGEVSPELAKQLGIPKDLKGAFVAHVVPGEAADKAGVQLYDVIIEFNGKKVSSSYDLIGAVTSVVVGETAKMKVQRGTKIQELSVKVSARPSDPSERSKRLEPPKKEKNKSQELSGITVEDLTADIASEIGLPENTKGAVISDVRYGSPADKAGLGRGDVIVEIDRKPCTSAADFNRTLQSRKSYLVRVRRADAQGSDAYSVVVLDLK